MLPRDPDFLEKQIRETNKRITQHNEYLDKTVINEDDEGNRGLQDLENMDVEDIAAKIDESSNKQ